MQAVNNYQKSEKLIFTTQPHLMATFARSRDLVKIILVALLLIIIGATIPPIAFFGMAIIYLTIGLFIYTWVRNSRTYYIVTNDQVIIEYRLFGASVKSFPLRNIQDMSFRYGLFGKLFNYGHFSIESAGKTGGNTFPYIKQPEKFLQFIQLATNK